MYRKIGKANIQKTNWNIKEGRGAAEKITALSLMRVSERRTRTRADCLRRRRGAGKKQPVAARLQEPDQRNNEEENP